VLRRMRDFRWYFLSIPIAGIVYALIITMAPMLRPMIFGARRAQIADQLQNHSMLVEVVQNEPTTVRLSPDALALKPGQSFEIQVWLDTAYTTRGVQFGFTYDPKLIEVTKVTEAEYYRTWAIKNHASTTVIPGVSIDAEHGVIKPLAIALLGGPPNDGPSGSGLIAYVDGRAKAGASGTTTLRLEGVEISRVEPSAIQGMASVSSVPSATVADTDVAIGDDAVVPTPPAARTAKAYQPPTPIPTGQ
jgi:hypothetical protein